MRSPSGWQGGLRQLYQGERPRSWHMVTHPRPVYGPMQTQGSCVRGRGSADTNPAPVCGILQGRPWCVQGRQRLGYAPCVSSHDSARSARVCAAALGLRARCTAPTGTTRTQKEDGLAAVLPRGIYSCWYFGLSPLARARPAGQCLRTREPAVTRNASSGGVLVSFANDRFCRLSLLGLCESDPLTLADGAGR